jgi:hypothetical protein
MEPAALSSGHPFYQMTLRRIPEDQDLSIHCREKLKSASCLVKLHELQKLSGVK